MFEPTPVKIHELSDHAVISRLVSDYGVFDMGFGTGFWGFMVPRKMPVELEFRLDGDVERGWWDFVDT